MNLSPVSIDILYEGMLVDFGIYYYQNSRPILLCKDLVLTSNMIRSLKEVLQNRKNVYMDRDNQQRLLKETVYFKNVQAQLEHDIGYDLLKASTENLFALAEQFNVIRESDIQEIASVINQRLDDTDSALIMQCINGVRQIDKYLYVHSVNVGFLNGLMGKWCGYNQQLISKLVKIGLVHDLGKLKVSPEILNKPGRLTKLEYEAVKQHPEFGYHMLRASGERDAQILDGVLHHHEKVNGTGYPSGQKGKKVSPFSKITAISDYYDAMTSKRPYKDGMPPFVIFEQIAQSKHSELDMEYTKIFLDNMAENLVGREVLLSSGAVAKVEYIDPQRLAYPIVSVDNHMVKTDKEIYCVRMYNQ